VHLWGRPHTVAGVTMSCAVDDVSSVELDGPRSTAQAESVVTIASAADKIRVFTESDFLSTGVIAGVAPCGDSRRQYPPLQGDRATVTDLARIEHSVADPSPLSLRIKRVHGLEPRRSGALHAFPSERDRHVPPGFRALDPRDRAAPRPALLDHALDARHRAGLSLGAMRCDHLISSKNCHACFLPYMKMLFPTTACTTPPSSIFRHSSLVARKSPAVVAPVSHHAHSSSSVANTGETGEPSLTSSQSW
jgi:hypothetical protein